MVQAPVTPESVTLTWTALLNIVNTVLVVIVGFFLKEAWTAIHSRIDKLEDNNTDVRERVASLEGLVERRQLRRS